jgi:hypothetical protein
VASLLPRYAGEVACAKRMTVGVCLAVSY